MKASLVRASLALTIILGTGSTISILSAKDKVYDEYNHYSHGVSVLNLLNGINLTADQQKKILALNKQVKNIKDSGAAEFEQCNRNAEEAMGNLYKFLLTHPEQEDQKVLSQAVKAVDERKNKSGEIINRINPELEKILKETESVLTAEQLAVINDFAPCVAPPKDFKNPVRAGQAKQSGMGVQMLSKARTIKDQAKLNEEINKATDKLIAHSMKKGKLTDEEVAAKRQEVKDVVASARSMSDTDFELKKDDLAQKLEPVNKIEQLRNEMEKRDPNPSMSPSFKKSRVAKFLLDPDIMIPVLETRLNAPVVGGLK